MSETWEDINFDEITEDAAKKTDDELASKISSLTRMTDDEVKKLFPQTADVEKLKKLMQIVNSAEDRNNKINNIIANTEELGGVILTLVTKFI